MTEKLSNLANKKKKILWGATFFLFLSFVAAAAAPLATTVELWPSNHSSGITIQIFRPRVAGRHFATRTEAGCQGEGGGGQRGGGPVGVAGGV